MNAIISNGDYTASVQLPVERKQLAGALSYLGKNHASAYDIKYNEVNKDGLKVTVQTAGPLTEEEEQDLKEWISGQNSDGIGEGFEQREIYFEGGHRGAFMYVSLWSPDDNYFIDNQDEFEDRLMSDGMTMGGM